MTVFDSKLYSRNVWLCEVTSVHVYCKCLPVYNLFIYYSKTYMQRFTRMHLCVRVRVCELMYLLACVQREVLILSLFRG